MKRMKALLAIAVVMSVTALGACNNEPEETNNETFDTIDENAQVVPDETDQIATPEEDFMFDSETAAITGYSDEGSKVVVIPDQIEGKDVAVIDEEAFKDKQIESVNIPATVTEIREGAFQGNQLESVKIPANVLVIGEEAFKDNQISEVVISESLQRIEDEAFRENNLTEVEVYSTIELGDEVFDDGVTVNRN